MSYPDKWLVGKWLDRSAELIEQLKDVNNRSTLDVRVYSAWSELRETVNKISDCFFDIDLDPVKEKQLPETD